jgi:hypothetical protein
MKSTVLFTSYFSKKIHPQFGDPHLEGVSDDGRVKQNDISYIQRWYESVKALGLNARIFCDNLSQEFIQKYETDKIKFVPVDTSDYSYNDWRFFCYRDYLVENHFDYVFMTDSSDVIVASDPSKIFESFPDIQYFVGKDSIKLHEFPYVNNHNALGFDNYFLFFINQYEWDLINVGAIGARYEDIVRFLNMMCDERIRIGHPHLNLDIWTGNYVFRHKLSGYKLRIGEPLTSNFKKYEYGRKDVCFIHK